MIISDTKKNNEQNSFGVNSRIFQKASSNYFFASKFFAKKMRERVYILYAYVRTADDFVDNLEPNIEGLQDFIFQTKKAFEGKETKNEIVNNLVKLANEVKFEKAWVIDFLEAMESDLHKKNYNNFAELEKYMYGSAEVIGLMMARIMELPPVLDEKAKKLGKAFQLINFIRDVKEDRDLGRNYLELSEDFDHKIEKYLDIYHELIKDAKTSFSHLPKRARIAIGIATKSYDWIAKEISVDRRVIFEKKVTPTFGLRLRWLFEEALKNIFL